jgi:hypothetical protein
VPLSGCDVEVTTLDATHGDLGTRVVTTDGDGRYALCVTCGFSGRTTVTSHAACCDVTSSTTFVNCPDTTVALDPLTCTDCSPCPAGMTRVEGRVRCRGGGTVPGCDLVIAVETCSGERLFRVTTDSEGKYRLCVPCPCPGGTVRVSAECCRASRTVTVDDCGPVTPIPTLFCPEPCR